MLKYIFVKAQMSMLLVGFLGFWRLLLAPPA
jgi:hypothetical protein